MKWYSYSYSMPCFRVRVLLTRSTSTKSQGKHRLILRNMRIAQLQSAPVAVAYGSDRLGTIDLPCATGGVFQCRAIVPNSSPRRACGGVFGFWLFDSLAAVTYGSDRLGTIDLPCATGGVFLCRAIVPNSSTRRASGGVFRFSAVCLTGCCGFRR
jgi:hypothetical protein